MNTSLLKTTILTAPAGWGKTRNAAALATEFGCTQVVDEWTPAAPLTIIHGALHLTNVPPSALRGLRLNCNLVARGWD
ncbi:MAG: hypothetical protein K9K35_10465 [Rhodoferax sp.]|nr:hypothetical protein [Rhodoferax sp.]